MKHDHESNPYQKYDDLFDAQDAKEVRAGKKEKAKEKKQADDRQASFDKPTRPIAGNEEPKRTSSKKNYTPLISIGIFYVILRTAMADSASSDAIRIVGIFFVIAVAFSIYISKRK
jgi:hypothetical protein